MAERKKGLLLISLLVILGFIITFGVMAIPRLNTVTSHGLMAAMTTTSESSVSAVYLTDSAQVQQIRVSRKKKVIKKKPARKARKKTAKRSIKRTPRRKGVPCLGGCRITRGQAKYGIGCATAIAALIIAHSPFGLGACIL
jgi:hypothetical protein